MACLTIVKYAHLFPEHEDTLDFRLANKYTKEEIMSMYLYLEGTREITVTATGNKDVQRKEFCVWYVNPKATDAILDAKDKKAAYVAYIASQGKDEVDLIYADSDYWQEGEPIGQVTINTAKEHIVEFEEWVREVESESYVLVWGRC
jgi:hypothetical protein